MRFDDHFLDGTLRVDYHHVVDHKTDIFAIDKIYSYTSWGRGKTNLIDNLNNGRYYAKIYDESSGALIYSKGFNCYAAEYKTCTEGLKEIKKAFHETIVFPAPRHSVKFVIETREKDQTLTEIFSEVIDPKSVFVIAEKNSDPDITVLRAMYNGPPETKVDVAIVGEGYSRSETGKFENDVKKIVDIFVATEPYRSVKSHFNIYGILKPSRDSGVSEPSAGIFKKSSLSASFDALGIERYLMTEDNKTLKDIASYVPYDAICILVNHHRFGGGGIYNYYSIFTSDNQFLPYLFTHEFGHSFGGLGDEYYTQGFTAEFYPRGVEPLEPNVTAMLNAEKLKWGSLVTPVPSFRQSGKNSNSSNWIWSGRPSAQNSTITLLN